MRALRASLLSALVLGTVGIATGNGQEPKDVHLVVQTGHGYPVMAVAFFPDGKRILTASGDFTLRTWDIRTGKELLVFRGHTNWVTAAALSPDGTRVVSRSMDKSMRVWDAATAKVLHVITEHAQGSWSVAFSPDGTRFAAPCNDKTARIWDVKTGKEVKAIRHDKPVEAVEFSPDGKHLLTGGVDKTARLWQIQSGKEIVAFDGHKEGVTAVAFGPGGTRIVTGSDDKTVRLWDTKTGEELKVFRGQAGGIMSVACSPDGKHVLATGEPDGPHTDQRIARIWDVETGKAVILRDTATRMPAAAFSPDGKFVATGGYHNLARVWDARTGKQVQTFTGQRAGGGLRSPIATFAGDGQSVFIGLFEQWDLRAGRMVDAPEPPVKDVSARAISHDRKTLAVTRSRDGGYSVEPETLRLRGLFSGKELAVLKGHTEPVSCVAFSPSDRQILTGSEDKTARLWNVQTGKLLKVFPDHAGELNQVIFSPNGSQILTLSWTRDRKPWGYNSLPARLWDARSGKELLTLRSDKQTGGVRSAAFSPDGTRILTGGDDDHTARLLDAKTGQELLAFRGHTGWVTRVGFSPDGTTVWTSGADQSARFWDLQTGKELGVFHCGGVQTPFAVTPDNRFVLVSHFLQAGIHIHDIRTGKELCTLYGFEGGTWAVVDSEGRYDASNGGDVEGLHWATNTEPIALSQLKERYYDPGLLAKYLGFNKERLREVGGFRSISLYPDVVVARGDPNRPQFDVTLTNRGGGIGKVIVLLNGKEVFEDARPRGADATATKLDVKLDLSADPRLVPGKTNRVEVLAYNAEGYLVSRGATFDFEATGAAPVEKPTVHAIVVGVSKYSGGGLDLRFAAKDADDFATALRIAAGRLFGAGQVTITLLNSLDEAGRPSRANVVKALEGLTATKPGDIVVVYLAGHGVTHGGEDGEWHYLTADAQSAVLTDPAVRKQVSLSSAELGDLLRSVPARKQVLILDTCHAGQAGKYLTEQRDVPGSQVRALERVKDRTGIHVLMGCAADSVSYEASRYGQGLLTYSLLLGMKGARLRDGEYVDVGELFAFAVDKVPELARDIGGVQRPTVASPKGASFDIGRLTKEDQTQVPIQLLKPVVLRSSFQEAARARDGLGLTKKVNDRLREASAAARGAKLVFVDSDDFPGALQVAGKYSQAGDKVVVNVEVYQGDKEMLKFTVEGLASKPDQLAEKLTSEVETRLAALGSK